MTYLIVDNDTNNICVNVTELVNRYPNAKEKAEETVRVMNENLILAGDVASFRVVEAPSNMVYLFDHAEQYLEADSEEEAFLVTQLLNEGLGTTAYELHPKRPNQVIYLCNKKC